MGVAGQRLRDFLLEEYERERAKRQSQALIETFPGTSQGRALPAAPIAREGGPAIPAVTIRRGGPAGEIIHLSATADSIASGGDYLTADTIVEQHGFSATTVGSEWTYPRSASYKLELDFEWDDHHDGGTVEVEVGGVVKRTMLGTGPGRRFTWSPAVLASKGDVGKVKVTQSSGSAKAATWTLTVGVMEPQKAIAKPTWEKVASVDAWGIFFDGTNWWVTEGATNEVRKYDSDWALQATYSVTDSDVIRGVTSDGTDIWVAIDTGTSSPDEYHVELNTSGVEQGRNGVGTEVLRDHGLAWDGTNLWCATGDTFDEFDTAGTLQSQVNTPRTLNWGLHIHGGDFVAVDNANSEIVVVNGSGVLQQTIGAYEIDGPTGVWVAADGTLYVSKDGDGVYKWNEGTL